MSDRPDLLAELTQANGELVTRLRELARRRALGEDVSADDLTPELQAHLDELLAAVLQVDAAAALPRQSRRTPADTGRHLAVVPPADPTRV